MGGVRVLPSGRYRAKWPDPSGRNLVPAPETFRTKKEAERWLDHKRTDLDRGTALDDKAGDLPLREWWSGYEETLGKLKQSTRANYATAWRLRVEPALGNVSFRHIRPSHIEAWIASMKRQGVSAARVVGAHGVLKRVLDRAVRDRVIATNPCDLQRGALPRRLSREHPVLSPIEVEQLARPMRRDDDRTIVRLLAYGGLRIGEALALRRRDLDPVRRTITIRESVSEVGGHLQVGPTKNYAIRTIVLPASLSSEIAQRLEQLPGDPLTLVFGNRNGEHRRYRVFRRDSWDPAIEASGIVANPHDLRATCASLLIDAGASVRDVSTHLGHAHLTTTMNIYTRVRPSRSEDLAGKMDVLLAEVRPDARQLQANRWANLAAISGHPA